LEKEKEFPIPIWQWAETQLEAEPGPASRFFPSPFLHSRTTHEEAQPTQRLPQRGPAGLLGAPRLATHIRPVINPICHHTRYRPDTPILTRYRIHPEGDSPPFDLNPILRELGFA
jgi:hypothetical protein